MARADSDSHPDQGLELRCCCYCCLRSRLPKTRQPSPPDGRAGQRRRPNLRPQGWTGTHANDAKRATSSRNRGIVGYGLEIQRESGAHAQADDVDVFLLVFFLVLFVVGVVVLPILLRPLARAGLCSETGQAGGCRRKRRVVVD
jgi:hypothetical protein